MIRRWIYSVILLCCALVACEKEQQRMQDEFVEVTLELQTPDATLVKSLIGDGTKAIELYYTAFLNGKPVESLQRKATLVNGIYELTLTLVKNVAYDFIFWAQYPSEQSQTQLYDLTDFYTEGLVKVNYSVPANDDNRDAFFAQRTIDMSSPAPDLSPVLMKRPFAQVNFAASDYDELKYMGLHSELKSGAVIYGLPDVLDCMDGSVYSSSDDGTYVDAGFLSASVPSGENEYVSVAGINCGYVGMNYVLASELPGQLFELKADFESEESRWTTGVVGNVPLKRNHRTYLYGNFFVDDVDLDILIIPAYEDENGNPNDDEIVEI